jgi:23S rRNA (cytosine1962-C5)-methyltransferase
MTILHQDTKWLVVNKPSGISTHRAHDGDLGLAEWLELHHDLTPHICSRLDKGTSGVILFALDSRAVPEAQRIHEEDRAEKCYSFIAKTCSLDSWVCNDPLDGKSCQTRFSTVRTCGQYTLYEARIHRGRTHQIRRHAAACDIPLLGDTEYKGADFGRLCLHCSTMQWPGIEHELRAPLPASFGSYLDGDVEEASLLALLEKRHPFLAGSSDCYRLLHRNEYSQDLAVDKYGDWLCVTGFNEQLSAKSLMEQNHKLLKTLCLFCNCRGGVVKTNIRDPHKKKLFADIASWGESIPQSFAVREGELQFTIHLNKQQHTGLFLDLRDCRRRIAHIAKGKRVANLFAFTCSFSIHALAAGAEVVFSVDLAAGCLRQGQDNVAINDLAGTNNSKFIKEDSRKWLARQLRKKQREQEDYIPFDIIICDPPVFAAADKGKGFHVEKEWPQLASNIYEILSKGGIALFANNHQAGRESYYHDSLSTLFQEVTRLKPPLDFPQIPGQAPHVRIYWCQK